MVDLTQVAAQGIAIFMPAYNEADNLRSVVTDAVVYLQSLKVPFAVIVVDDGSTDGTADVVRSLQINFPNIQLVQHEQNCGYGAALRTGFQAALLTGYDWIGYCDSDGQFKPHDFGKLIGHAEMQGADICIGYRIERADGLKRRLIGRGWHTVSRFLLRYEAIDVDCGFKVLRRSDAIVRLLSRLVGNHAAISPEILARAHRADLKIVEIGVDHYPRQHGEQSGTNLHVIVESILGLASLRHILMKETA